MAVHRADALCENEKQLPSSMKRTVLSLTTAIAAICCEPANGQDVKTACAKSSLRELQERVAKELEEASPIADPGDARARDAAAAKLAGCNNFLAAAGKRMLWGGCDPVKGYDPKIYTLTEFDPLVWL